MNLLLTVLHIFHIANHLINVELIIETHFFVFNLYFINSSQSEFRCMCFLSENLLDCPCFWEKVPQVVVLQRLWYLIGQLVPGQLACSFRKKDAAQTLRCKGYSATMVMPKDHLGFNSQCTGGPSGCQSNTRMILSLKTYTFYYLQLILFKTITLK